MPVEASLAEWKRQARVDYFNLFVPLWFYLNAWMRARFAATNDRDVIELMKQGGNEISDEFAGLIQSTNASGNSFRGNLGALQRSLQSAEIRYDSTKHKGQKVDFGHCAIDWKTKRLDSVLLEYAPESVVLDEFEDADSVQTSGSQGIEIDDGLWVENDTQRLFAAYLEIVYQVRCALFHGGLAPTRENERVIRYTYLTLSAVMEDV